MGDPKSTRSYAIAEGLREALVKSCNYKTSHLKTKSLRLVV